MEEEDESFVMLVYKLENKNKTIDEKWQEFSLPLQLYKVEKWCKLKNLYFLRILNQKMNQKEYKVDTSKLKSTNLENSNFYLVCGENEDNDNDEEFSILLKTIIYIFNLIYFYIKNILNFLFSEFWW
eukprot:gene9875-2197_t